MQIRRAEAKDLPEVKALLDQVDMVHHNGRPDIFKIGRKYDDEQLLALFKNDNRPIYVAVGEDDRAMGYVFCIYIQHPEDNVLTDIKTLYIDDFCVFEKYRGKGIGHALYQHVLQVAKDNGCYNVTLHVWECNPAAMKFYKSLGMEPLKYELETKLQYSPL